MLTSAALTGEFGINPLGIWCYEKLGIDFVRKPSVLGCMAKSTNDDIRKLFTEIGCIMEDASLIALVWGADDELNVRARYRKILGRVLINRIPISTSL